jgi:alkylation response protein AidB-like acyl-CoA dehydrogenase
MIRMAATQAARTGADVTRLMFEQAGTAGIFNSHPFSRLFRMRWWSTSTPSSTRPPGRARARFCSGSTPRRFP